MLTNILSFPVAGPAKLSLWLLRTIAERAEAELYSEENIRRELGDLEIRQDMGEISEEDFLQAEDALLERLRESRRRAQANKE